MKPTDIREAKQEMKTDMVCTNCSLHTTGKVQARILRLAQETQTCMSVVSQRKLMTYSPSGRSAGTCTLSTLDTVIW